MRRHQWIALLESSGDGFLWAAKKGFPENRFKTKK
jgi:hypothetical protein